jgi:thioredoxin reductase (NADPH)
MPVLADGTVLSGDRVRHDVSSLSSGAKLSVCVIGGSNPAGQVAIALAQEHTVALVMREASFENMAEYLATEIMTRANIAVYRQATLSEYLPESGHVRIKTAGVELLTSLEAEYIFPFVGSESDVSWIGALCDRDQAGSIVAPDQYTAVPGLFIAGSVRAGADQFFVPALGEGASAAEKAHQYLQR